MIAADTPMLADVPLDVEAGQPAPPPTTGVEIDPIMGADRVVKGLLLALLDVLEANVPGACRGEDIECLHDLRVANRRARTVLGQMRELFPEASVVHFRERFVWVQQFTGPARDLDVYRARFDGYLDLIPLALRFEMEPLRGYLDARSAEAQDTLALALRSAAFLGMLAEWRAFLTEPASADPPLAAEHEPIRDLVDRRIRRMAKRVRREGRAITADSPPEALHELRKSCKKLRYLMELFQSLYPRERILPLIKQIKTLLTALGDFQDLTVQVRHLQETARDMHAAGQSTPGVLLGMGALAGQLIVRQDEQRGRCAESFAAFDSSRHWRDYKTLFWGSE